MDNKKILEALQIQPLSDDEKASRHILGRLYGPIATSLESTRNGRKYNRELWEKALADDLFHEKIATKSLLLELGHPLDREETDMSKACACIPEMPKIVDGDLYAYVDILDTVNGRTLKTLIDYGFVPGISSRGSGDIMENDEVDPETFFLETWDIVQLPAVKKARLSVCESVDTTTLKLKKALTESYEAASEEDKEKMKEALDNLDIELDEARSKRRIVPELPDDMFDAMMTEGVEEDAEQEEENIESAGDDAADKANAELEADVAEVEDGTEEAEAEEDSEKAEGQTVKDFTDKLKDYDKDLMIEFEPIVIDDKEIAVQGIEFDDSTEGKLAVKVSYDLATGDNTEAEEPAAEEAETEAEANLEAEESSEEAIDDGTDETIESLKEMIRQKDALEDELNTLKNEKTVSDAEVKDLKEEVERYKVAFGRVSELASKATKFKQDVNSLKEQLTQKDTQINELQGRAASAAKLTESMNENASRVKKLTEKLNAINGEHAAEVNALNEEVAQCKKKLADRTKVAKYYKEQFAAVLNRYVESKASMLGVKPSDITRRLNENYTIDDVDSVCDDILTQNVNMSRLSFGIDTKKSKVRVNESVNPVVNKAKNDDDDEFNSLLELAGIDHI